MEEELQRAVGTPQEQISYCCRALSLKFCLYNMPGNYFSLFQSIFEVVGKIATRRNLVNEAGEPRNQREEIVLKYCLPSHVSQSANLKLASWVFLFLACNL